MKLPVVSGAEVVAVYERLGYAWVRTRGSHAQLRDRESGRMVTVPLHRELDRGTLRSILRQTQLSVERFCEVLGR